MRFIHSSIEKYLKENEHLFLGKAFFSPVVLSKDTILFFSQEKNRDFLCFDLSTRNPCFYINKTDSYFESLNSVFASQLRAISNEFMIVDYELSKNDFIIKFRVAISNNENENLLFHFEVFPNHPNLIVTDLKNKVITAFYHSKDGRPENNSVYVSPTNEKLHDGDTELTIELIEKLFAESVQKRRLDKYQEFISNLQTKIKKCKTKIRNIEQDKMNAELQQNYQQIADNLLISGINLKQRLTSIEVDGEIIELDGTKTISENIQLFYKKVKKSKETIRLVETNLERANNEINLYESILQQLYDAPNEKEADKVVSSYSFSKKHEVRVTEFNKPWKINYQGVYFYFGKNSSQNDYLSFVMKQDRQFTWVHIKDRSGSHIVIASLKPTEDQLLFASELALYLSKQKTGEVQYTRKKNIRRGHSLGEAIVKNYSTIKINNIRERSLELFETAKRCD
ncbi:MAG: NFACT family protein [Bacilli bacterium]|nr:NFACT family protein [Bacilli bacterium]